MGALTLVLGPAVTGYLVVNRVDAALQRLSLLNNVQWNVVERERGWFQSVLQTELSIAGYAPLPTQLELVHGPLYLGMINRRRSPFLMAYLRASPPGAQSAPEFLAELQFNGDWSAELPLQEVVLNNPDANPAEQFRLQAFRADIAYRAGLKALALRAAADTGTLGESGEQARLIDIALLGEYRLDTSGWLFGDTSLRVASLAHPPTEGRLAGLELTATSSEAGTLAAANVGLRAESFDILERSFGAAEIDVAARNVSVTELRNWIHRADSFSGRALHRLGADADLRLSAFTIRDGEGAALTRATGSASIAPEKAARSSLLKLDLSASRAFAEFVFWHGAKRTLGRSALFGKLNELEGEQQSAVARDSAAKQLSVLASRGYLTWNRGWYRTRITFDAGRWALNGRPVNVR